MDKVIPSYEEVVYELVDGAIGDSLSQVEVMAVIDTEVDALEADNLQDEIAALPDAQARLRLFEEGLKAGMEFETTLFGIPVRVAPIQEGGGPSPDPSGDREPLRPIQPDMTDAKELELVR